MITNTKASMDKIIFDNLNTPPLPMMPCIHHWVLEEQGEGKPWVFAGSVMSIKFLHLLFPLDLAIN
jgi:hypothetical protein